MAMPPEQTPPAPPPAIGTVNHRQAALALRFPAWPARTLDQMLDAAAAEFPTRPYLITDTQTWSYSDIKAWSERLAAGLLAAGVQPGDHVAMLMANHPEFVAVKFAIARVGAVAVPINFLNRRDELGYVLRQSDAVLLVTMDSFRGLDYLGFLDELAPGWAMQGGGTAFPRLKQVVVFPASGQAVRAGAQALGSLGDGAAPWQAITHPGPASNSDIIYTSGTTGSPKGVMLSHDMMLRAAFGSAWGRAFEDGRRVLFSLPMYHVYGYVEGLLSVLFVGGAIVPVLMGKIVDANGGLAKAAEGSIAISYIVPLVCMVLVAAYGLLYPTLLRRSSAPV